MAAPSVVPKKRQKKKAENEPEASADPALDEAEQELNTETAVEAEVATESDLPEKFRKDTVLGKVALKLQRIYKCMNSFFPQEKLRLRAKAGRQIRGAGLVQIALRLCGHELRSS